MEHAQTITEARALADRLDGLRSFGPEHFAELQAAVNTIRHLTVLLSSQAQDANGPVKAGRCRFFGFGTAPQAGALGYYLARTTEGTDLELQEKFGNQDVILVRGATCASKIGAHEYAVFVPAPRYTVLSLHKTQGWFDKCVNQGLWPVGDHGQMSERTWIVQDADLNRLALTQHKLRDLPLDSSGFTAAMHEIAAQLVKIGVLQIVSSDGKSSG